jgi:hypothetical protein
MFEDVSELWDKLLEEDLFTEEELQLVTSLNGYSIETLNDALYVRHGYRTHGQMQDEEEDEDEEDNEQED